MRRYAGSIARLLLLAVVVTILWSVPDLPLSPAASLVLIWAGPVLAYPVVWVGRLVLDRTPTASGVRAVTAAVQTGVGLSLGAPLVRAITTQADWPGVVLGVPRPLGAVLAALTGLAATATVATLALRGLGAPFFIKLSSRLATDWLYRWTRNPMVLATICWLACMGLWYQSLLFVVWVLADVTPALLFFVRHFEERELELRFGDSYRAYRDATPFLIPGRPRMPS